MKWLLPMLFFPGLATADELTSERIWKGTNKNDVPSHWAGDELVFNMSPSNPMIVCRPYVFADPEKKGPPPPDPGFGPRIEKK